MSGMVFHPGHEELHGVTVVVEGPGGRTWAGRYHERIAGGIVLLDASLHDPATAALPRDAWIQRLLKFGIPADARHVVIPEVEAERVTRLLEWKAPM